MSDVPVHEIDIVKQDRSRLQALIVICAIVGGLFWFGIYEIIHVAFMWLGLMP